MKKLLTCIIFISVIPLLHAQDDGRILLRGKVIYKNTNVVNENVINTTTQNATITDENGEFLIRVKEDDELVFTAVNFEYKIVKITAEVIKKNRLVVDVKEKVRALDEVVVSPEDEQRFLELQNEELKQYEYEIDRSSEVENIGESQVVRGSYKDGLNFVGIFKALSSLTKKKDKGEGKEELKMSSVLRQIYDEDFFTTDLKLPKERIQDFLYYCDQQMPSKTLLRKENEFELIEFLVTNSQTFLKELKSEK